MKVFIRIITLTLVLVFIMSLSVCAYADTYDLNNGMVTVSCNDAGVQQVSQLANSINEHPDPDPIITGQYTGNGEDDIFAALILSENGDTNVTFENITLTDCLIHVAGDGDGDGADNSATLTFQGNNTINEVNFPQGLTFGYMDTVTIQGSDNSTLNINSEFSDITDYAEKSFGILAVEVENVDIKNINLNISGTDVGILTAYFSESNDTTEVLENIKIENSNVNLDCKDFTIGAELENAVPSLEKCAEQIVENGHVEKLENYLYERSSFDFWTIFDENGEPATHATIRRPITVQPSKNTSDTDDIGIHESNAFSFNTGLRHLIQIICNGDVLEEGKDYIIDIVDGMEIIKFTEEFFLKYGDGPVPVCVEYTDMIYNLSAINTK